MKRSSEARLSPAVCFPLVFRLILGLLLMVFVYVLNIVVSR